MKPHGSAPCASASIQRPITYTCPFVVQYNHAHSGGPLWSLRPLWSRGALRPAWARNALRSSWPSLTLRPLGASWSRDTLWALSSLLPLRASGPRLALRPWRTLCEAGEIGAAKLAGVRIHQHRLYWGFRSHRNNPSQKYRLVNIRVADSDHPRLASYSVITNVDVVIARGQIGARAGAQSDVAVAGSVPEERERAMSRVGSAGSGILICRVEEEGTSASGRVKVAHFVALERKHTKGSIVSAGGQAQKGVLPLCRVASVITALRRGTDRL